MDKSTNERREETTFVDVTLWGRTAEVAGEYLAKGRPCLIEGRLQLDQWEDKETGQKRSKLKVVGDTLQLLGSRDGGSGGTGSSDGTGGGGYSPAPQPERPPASPQEPPPAPPQDQHQTADRSPDQTFYDDVPKGPTDDEVPF